MNIQLKFNASAHSSDELVILPSFSKGKGDKATLVDSDWTKELRSTFKTIKSASTFKGAKGSSFQFTTTEGLSVLIIGLGEKSDYDYEALRRATAGIVKKISGSNEKASIMIDGFVVKNKIEESMQAFAEAFYMTTYNFDKYLSKKNKPKLKNLFVESSQKTSALKKAQIAFDNGQKVAECVNVGRDFVNEPPNVLNSVTYAKEIEKDVKANLKGVKVKILGKAELKKEKMNMFLSVNNGSAHDARLVHLEYTPKKATKKTKHIALVGKGLTFDTGGYSLKPGGSMMNMKFDMAGSATVYAAFRAAVLLGLDVKVSCFLGMTDNAVNEHATMPDSIVTARNGKTVEILNTDAEGRLVLGDVLSYASDLKPDAIIDAATLTGACLVALGTEVCAVLGNDKKLTDSLLSAAKETDEYMWPLPIIEEWRDDMKGSMSDLKNIGGSSFGGTAKAAAFLENFVGEGVSWAHLDIAGVGDSQKHLPYCPSKGASGIIVRSLVRFLANQK